MMGCLSFALKPYFLGLGIPTCIRARATKEILVFSALETGAVQ